MIQLAWRWLRFQPDSALAKWYHARTDGTRGSRKTFIVALARKLLIALWRLVTTGEGRRPAPGRVSGRIVMTQRSPLRASGRTTATARP